MVMMVVVVVLVVVVGWKDFSRVVGPAGVLESRTHVMGLRSSERWIDGDGGRGGDGAGGEVIAPATGNREEKRGEGKRKGEKREGEKRLRFTECHPPRRTVSLWYNNLLHYRSLFTYF